MLNIINIRNWKRHYSSKLGYLLIILAAAFAGLLEVVGKPLVDSADYSNAELNPIALSLYVYIIILLFFSPIAKKTQKTRKILKKDYMIMACIGIAEVSAITLNFFGLMGTTAVNSSIIGNTEIIFAVIIAIAFFKERLQRSEYLPFAMIVFGAMLLPVGYEIYQTGFEVSSIVTGDLLIILGAFFYAIDMNISKFVSKQVSAAKISQISAFGGIIFATGLIFMFQIPLDLSFEQLPDIIFIGIFATGMSSLFFVLALRLIGAVRTIILYSTTTIFGVLFAGLFLAEEISLIHIFSMATAGVGIYMLRNRLSKDELDDDSEEIDEEIKSRTNIVS